MAAGPRHPDPNDGAHPRWDVVRMPYGGAGPGDPRSAAVLVPTLDRPVHWLPGQRFHELFDTTCVRLGPDAETRPAIETEFGSTSFAALARLGRATAVALAAEGVGPGTRVALLLDRSVWAPAVVLALSRLGASWVPLDASFPDDRIEFICADAGVSHVVTAERLAGRFPSELRLTTVERLATGTVDRAHREPVNGTVPAPPDPDPVAYVIYTSGSTGKPKGVPIRHSSICNFVAIASTSYGYRPGDRVYQGMTIAFDFSFEESWVPLMAGATIVPAPGERSLVGDDLQQFLTERRITALCCVPTLLATLEPTLPGLRLLLVSGEACPPDVIEPWLTPDRRVLNAYGPTETTVTATWSVLEAGRPLTIGGPLPTYAAVILDPVAPEALAPGEAGELAIAGVGLSDGYLNRPEQTARAFVPDFIGIPANPTGTLYRTGDLARFTDDGEIEYLGRIDTQVKIRGYRIELDEIEVVARRAPTVGNAVVNPYTAPGATAPELVAYLTPAGPGGFVDVAAVDALLRLELPSYMVPTFYEVLDSVPMLASTKADRAALPPPRGPRFGTAPAGPGLAPTTPLEQALASCLATVLGIEELPVDRHFIEQLGANSLTLARFVTEVRRRLDTRISVKQLYQHATIAALAASMEEPPTGGQPGARSADHEPIRLPGPLRFARPHRPSRTAIVATAFAQIAYWIAFAAVASFGTIVSVRFVDRAGSFPEAYLRAVVAASVVFVSSIVILVGVRWVAMGTVSRVPIPIYSARYVRFWIGRMAIQSNPANLLVGTPTYHLYLRALGVHLGRAAVVLTRPPICPGLVSIGDRAVVRERANIAGYRVTDGYVCPGPIDIGPGALVAEATVVDIGTVLGAGAQLGASSSLQRGQRVPPRTRVQGSPAVPTETNYDRVTRWKPTRGRATRYAIFQSLSFAGLVLPVTLLWAWSVHSLGLELEALVPWTGTVGRLASGLAIGAVLVVSSLVLAVVRATLVPRLVRPLLRVGEPHPLYGFQYHLTRMTMRFSNNPVLHSFFGDSSLIVHYLRLIGYDMRGTTQTGSNFGMTLRHHVPSLCRFERNTLVSDGLALTNTEISAASFIVRPIHVPRDTYLGNQVNYPGRSMLGENCLIATKAAIPISGEVREGVGILGSPAFEIPRSVARDHAFDLWKDPALLQRQLRRKLRTNLVTMAAYLLRSWLLGSISMVFILEAFPDLDTDSDPILWATLVVTASVVASALVGFVVLIGFERAARGNRPIPARFCSLYDREFWRHERYWKLNYSAFTRLFVGSPIRPVMFRLAGARIGAGVFDDGAGLIEPSMLEIGAGTTLNAAAVLQCHSLEDGTFKSGRTAIGRDCTISPGAFVHYGVRLADSTTVEPDSFVMKGSTSSPRSRWLGNPAAEWDPVESVDDGPIAEAGSDPDGRRDDPERELVTGRR